MHVIQLRDVSVYYGSICALKDINLQIEEREFLGILGPNGGGKTTLVKLLLGLMKPTSGTVSIRTEHHLGYVPQTSKFDRTFPITVLDVVLTGLLPCRVHLFHKYSLEDRKKSERIMSILGIWQLRGQQMGDLSGGQLQKVLIARALVSTPDILLLDEPTSNIDAQAKTETYALLKELNKNITIVMVSHDLGVISSYTNSIACLNQTLYYHGLPELTDRIIASTYGCPVDLIAHGIPHRVLRKHEADQSC